MWGSGGPVHGLGPDRAPGQYEGQLGTLRGAERWPVGDEGLSGDPQRVIGGRAPGHVDISALTWASSARRCSAVLAAQRA